MSPPGFLTLHINVFPLTNKTYQNVKKSISFYFFSGYRDKKNYNEEYDYFKNEPVVQYTSADEIVVHFPELHGRCSRGQDPAEVNEDDANDNTAKTNDDFKRDNLTCQESTLHFGLTRMSLDQRSTGLYNKLAIESNKNTHNPVCSEIHNEADTEALEHLHKASTNNCSESPLQPKLNINETGTNRKQPRVEQGTILIVK